jgi:hypothetical protein
MKRPRIELIEHAPSQVLISKHGRRSTKKLLLEADGVNAMCNPDGSITIECYNQQTSILLRLTPEDVRSQTHVLKKWKELR